MVCPKCGNFNIFIVDSRTTINNTVRRRRKCDCGYKWSTYEVPALEIKRINKIYEFTKKIIEQSEE